MPNNTRKDYKEAIRIKFEIEKLGVNEAYFNPPSQANLRELCWKILKANPHENDLNVYSNFFGYPFNLNEEDTSTPYTDKFRKVGDFLKGIKDPARIDTVELAAILVDFEVRPYQKFFLKFKDPTEAPDTPSTKKGEEEGDVVEENPETSSTERENEEEDENEEEGVESTIIEDTPVKISFWEQLKHIFTNKPTGRLKKTLLGVVVIFGLIATVIYFAFFKMHCMQWSEDHYEIVDCTPETSARTNLNPIIPLDDRLLDFRKVAVCDTTTCFRPDGQAIVWYAKNKDKAEFFNSNGIGRHPETERALRPVTEYIKGKYKIPCDLKQK